MKNQLFTVLFTLLTLSIFGQNTAQQFNIAPPVIVNFTDRADYELTHPTPIVQIMIEQIEDKDDHFEYVSKDVDTTNAIKFNINNPSRQHRATLNSPSPLLNINGVMDAGRLIPPDIRGAAGSTYIMETTNQEFKVYDKSGVLNRTVSIPTFFSTLRGSGYFDPHVCFDMNYNRWIITIGGKGANGKYGVYLAISLTDNPNGSWYLYFHDGQRTTGDFIDYPLLGYNKNWVVVTANDFAATGNIIGKIYVFNRQQVYSGIPTTVSEFSDNTVYTLSPAETYDTTQSSLFMVQNWNGSSNGYGYVKVASITGTPTSPVYSSGVTIGVNKTWSNSGISPTQKGTLQTLEGSVAKIGNCIYRNNSLWFCQSALLPSTSPNYCAAQWWQVNPSNNSVIQFGRIEQAGVYHFYPSIAVSSANDVIVGYCKSSPNHYASAAYSVRAFSDSANTMRSENVFKPGLAGYYKVYSGGRNRWGDYTGTCIDPSTNSFWVFGQWANTSNRWATQIAAVPSISNTVCLPPTVLNSSNITDSTATVSWNSVSGATSYNLAINERDSSYTRIIPVNGLTYNITGLKKGTIYDWKVQPICGNNITYYSSIVYFLTTGWVCNAPTNLYPGNVVRNNQVTGISNYLSWTINPSAQNYHIQIRKVGTSVWRDKYTTGSGVTIDSLTPLTTYEWRVQSICLAGSESVYANGGNFTTLAIPACGIPHTITTTNIQTKSAYITWKYPNYVYVKFGTLRYKPVSSSTWIVIDSICPTCSSNPYFSFKFNQACLECLTPGTAYEYQIRANCVDNVANCCVQSGWSASTYFTTLICQPIGSVAVAALTTTSATLAWGSQSGDGYKIYYKKASATAWSSVTTTGLTYNLTGLSTGTTYNWTIRNTCGVDTSSLYPTQTFTTLSCNSYPTTLSTTNISYSSASLTWNQDFYGDGYKVQWRKVGTTTWSSAVINGYTSPFYNVNSLTSNTNYEWQVATRCGTNTYSQFSQIITFKTTGNCPSTHITATYVLSKTLAYLGWYNVGATSYTVAYHPVGNPTWSYITSTGLNTTITVSSGTSYEWKVRCNCGTDTSAYSPVATFVTAASPELNEEVKSIKIFPNPNDGTFTIQGNGTMSIKIYDAQGKILFDDICVDECIVTTKLSKGMYVLKVNKISYKLIING